MDNKKHGSWIRAVSSICLPHRSQRNEEIVVLAPMGSAEIADLCQRRFMSRLMTGTARECCGADSKDKGDTSNGCAEASIHVKLLVGVSPLMLPRCQQDFKCGIHPRGSTGATNLQIRTAFLRRPAGAITRRDHCVRRTGVPGKDRGNCG